MVCDCFFVCACLDRGLPPRRHAPVPKHSEQLPARAEWINKVIWEKGSSFPGIDFRQDESLCNVCSPLHFLFVLPNQGPLKFTVNWWWTILLWCMTTFSLKSQNPAGKKKDFYFFRFLAKLHQKLTKNSQGVLRQVVLQRFLKISLFLTLDLRGKQ